MLTPGLFDIQVNGFAGVDFNDAKLTADRLDHALEAMLACGVTACLPTIISANPDQLAARLGALDAAVARSRLGPRMVPGYHLEGPFLSPLPGYRGCHPAGAMQDADRALLERLEHALLRPILLVTLAPEIDGAVTFTRWATGRGKVVALGHTAATAAQITAAVEAGASVSTHLGNGLAHTQHKFANPLMAQLAEVRLTASFIADGIHVPAAVLGVLMRARGIDRCILVSDAVAPAGAAPGRYGFAGMNIVRHTDGRVTDDTGSQLAGSALTMDEAVRNVVAWGVADFPAAVAMASRHPASLLERALQATGARIADGRVAWSDEQRVTAVWLDGDQLHHQPVRQS